MTNKTIAAGNVVLKMKGEGVIAEANRIKAEMRSIRTIVKQSIPDTTRYANEMKALADAFKRGDINGGQFARSQDFLQQKYKVVTQAQQEAIRFAEKEAALKQKLAASSRMNNAWLQAEVAIGKTASIETRKRIKDMEDLERAQRKVSASTMAAVNARRGGAGLMDAAGMMGAGQFTSLLSMGKAGGIAAGIGMGLMEGIKAQASAEKAIATFSVLLGSVDQANSLLNQMRDIARSSPLRLTDMQAAAQTMLSFGIEGEKLIPTLKQLGDITGGDSMRFQMLSLAFAQSAAAGRLMGQDLLQMINAGFNPLQVISQQTGKSLVDLRKEMENGLITFDMVESAFRTATSEGGKFNGMLTAQAETISGQWRGLLGQIDALKIQIGQAIGPGVTAALKSLQGVFIGLNFAVEKLAQGVVFLYSGLADIVNLDFGFTRTNEFLDSLNQSVSVQEELVNSAERQNKIVESTASYYKQIADSSSIVVDVGVKIAKAGDDYEKLINQNFETMQKLTFGEERFLEIQRQGAGWSKEQLENIRRQESIIKSMTAEKNRLQQLEKEQEKFRSDAESEKKRLEDEKKRADEIGSTNQRNPSIINADSSEAYRFVMNSRNDQIKKLEEQKRIQMQQLEVQRRIQMGIERIPQMGVAG